MATTPAVSLGREQQLLAYVADLELEVDRLRKQSALIEQTAVDAIREIEPLCAASGDPAHARIVEVTQRLSDVLDHICKPIDYDAAQDQVVAIGIRPLLEQILRWQQRLHNAPFVSLHVELDQEHVSWFPARLRHILDNLISNALRYRDTSKGESRISVALSVTVSTYELRITDNGRGMVEESSSHDGLESFHESSPARSAELGVGLAVVKSLIEHSGGTLVRSGDFGHGTSFLATLPRYDVDDFLA